MEFAAGGEKPPQGLGWGVVPRCEQPGLGLGAGAVMRSCGAVSRRMEFAAEGEKPPQGLGLGDRPCQEDSSFLAGWARASGLDKVARMQYTGRTHGPPPGTGSRTRPCWGAHGAASRSAATWA
jgi:hypothetical protein